MADFVQIMNGWRRMCEHYTTDDAASCCNGCPMDGRGCGAIYEDGNAEPEIIEREVQRWAAENPEPVYPTWEQVIAEMYLRSGRTKYHNIKEWEINEPIPADIAQKLGIEPKEG